ncbi:MAG: cell division protein FtsA [Bacteroidia bacterium]
MQKVSNNDNKEIIVGLDIGTTKICAIVGTRNEYGKMEVLGMGKAESLGVTRGVVSNIEKTVDAIRKAIKEAEDEAGVDIRVVNVGIAGQHIQSQQYRNMITRQSMDDEISRADIDKLVDSTHRIPQQPGYEIIHVLPQEFIVDNEVGIKDPIGMSGIRLEANFHIITGHVTAANNIYKCVQKAGLTANDLILEPLASADAVLSEEEKEAGVVLVDIGGGTTDIAIFQDGIIRHTAVIPFGGNIITEDIKEGCTVLRQQAELLKIRFGSALASETQDNEIVSIPGLRGREPKEISVRNLASIIQARIEEIIELVHYEIKSSGFEKKLIAGIVLTGGGSQLRNLRPLVEYLTGMDVRIGTPNEHLAKGDNDVKSPMYATGIGLVLMGLNKQEQKTASAMKQNAAQGREQATKRPGLLERILQKGKEWIDDPELKDSKDFN